VSHLTVHPQVQVARLGGDDRSSDDGDMTPNKRTTIKEKSKELQSKRSQKNYNQREV